MEKGNDAARSIAVARSAGALPGLQRPRVLGFVPASCSDAELGATFRARSAADNHRRSEVRWRKAQGEVDARLEVVQKRRALQWIVLPSGTCYSRASHSVALCNAQLPKAKIRPRRCFVRPCRFFRSGSSELTVRSSQRRFVCIGTHGQARSTARELRDCVHERTLGRAYIPSEKSSVPQSSRGGFARQSLCSLTHRSNARTSSEVVARRVSARACAVKKARVG